MSTPQGLKHVATEPAQLDNKRDVRRRGAAGRAAVLRRAPSDSDCSGETASLSADSNERLRPALPPPRANKTRSRRRGSEWEVLEGLKDGQRFERRPDVFNGYLHKKRKWPLKGWHKRFFVVDGGILVYARSPTDVARGRLHGSVDVGLSVISAKARRRRIDIDADEFIYHLRAKTPDVFRTWLTVLKTHRLYRQHLLTFGARESVPKIHAPLEDLPPTDTSSRTTLYTLSSSNLSREYLPRFPKEPLQTSPGFSREILCYNQSPIYLNTERKRNKNSSSSFWLEDPLDTSALLPLKFEPFEQELVNVKSDMYNHSLCSMKCMERMFEKDYTESKKDNDSSGVSQAENQIVVTELDRNSLNNSNDESPVNYSVTSGNEDNKKEKNNVTVYPVMKSQKIKQSLTFFEKNIEPTAALFLFPKRKRDKKRDRVGRNKISDSVMRKSNKSTNLVKYKNFFAEPPLKKPLSKSMLLYRHKLKVSRQSGLDRVTTRSDEVQAVISAKENKSLQDVMTASECDHIAEKLINNIFQSKNYIAQTNDSSYDVQFYVNHMVRELYDIKFSQSNVHPVKVLFRCLLEYWLKNSGADNIRNAIKQVKSIDIQSHKYFTQDAQLSSLIVPTATEHTQFHGYENYDCKLDKRRIGPTRQGTHSFIKERRIQELERLLKSTVYTCETLCNNRSKEKDIAITKKLIDNLNNPKGSYNSSSGGTRDNSESSTEFPEIQETFNHLISETSIPPDVAKEFLAAYLDVLVNDSITPGSTTSSVDTKESHGTPECDVQAESVQKKMSVGVITAHKKDTDKSKEDKLKGDNLIAKETTIIHQDPGQKYLKDVLDKITAIFTKVPKTPNKNVQYKDAQPDDTKVEGSFPSSKNTYSVKKLVFENKDAIVVDLTKYRLDHISLIGDPDVQGIASIVLKLKERPPSFGESKQKNLSFKFSGDESTEFIRINGPDGLLIDDSKKYLKTSIDPKMSIKNPYIDYNPNCQKERIELKPFLSTSDATSKAYKLMYESEHSFDFSTKTGNLENNNDSKKSFEGRDDLQSCYILSSLKKKLFGKDETVPNPTEDSGSTTRRSDATETDKPNPKIIDEKFILLLLENLTLLSQNVPGLYKDINTLYVRLKKKHEKDLRNFDARLGLLGKIYKDSDKVTNGNATKLESSAVCDKPLLIKSSKSDIGVNTMEVFLKSLVDKVNSATLTLSVKADAVTQTFDAYRRKSVTFVDAQVSKQDFRTEYNKDSKTVTVDAAVSNTNWFDKVSKQCSTTMCVIVKKRQSFTNFRLDVDKRLKSAKTANELRFLVKNKNSPENVRLPERLMGRKMLPGNPSTVKDASGSAQTGAQKTRKLKKDFNVYQLFVSSLFPPTMSNSLSDSNGEAQKSESDLKTIYRCASEPSYCSGVISPLRGPQAGFVAGTPGGRLASWILESGGPLENASRELGQAQLSVQQLQRLLDALELQHQHHDTDQVSLEGASPNVKKDRRKFGLRKKKSGNKCASVDLAPAPAHLQDVSASHMALSALTAPPSPGGGASSMPNSAASLPID